MNLLILKNRKRPKNPGSEKSSSTSMRMKHREKQEENNESIKKHRPEERCFFIGVDSEITQD